MTTVIEVINKSLKLVKLSPVPLVFFYFPAPHTSIHLCKLLFLPRALLNAVLIRSGMTCWTKHKLSSSFTPILLVCEQHAGSILTSNSHSIFLLFMTYCTSQHYVCSDNLRTPSFPADKELSDEICSDRLQPSIWTKSSLIRKGREFIFIEGISLWKFTVCPLQVHRVWC